LERSGCRLVEHEVEEAEVVVDVCSLDIFAGNPEKEGVEEGIVVCQGFYDCHFANVAGTSASDCCIEFRQPFWLRVDFVDEVCDDLFVLHNCLMFPIYLTALMTQIRIGELYLSVRTGDGRVNGEELSTEEACNLDLENVKSKVCFYKRNTCQLLPPASSCGNYSLVLRLQKCHMLPTKIVRVCLRSYDPILNWEVFPPTFSLAG